MRLVFREESLSETQKKADLAFCRLLVQLERRGIPKLERREIFKGLLRAAGYAGIRIRDRVSP